ncbi:MAG: hypothetical protein ACD_61C00246G0006 [uncultured bacterium]|nr:MAG: hypothetical protein ACD_61C00246G0006 [uncultured bacterium]
MKKITTALFLVPLFLIAGFLLLPVSKVLAATSSATPTASASATPSQTQDIQEKIKALVKENLSATESTLKERINQKTLVGYVGLIQSINSGNISINTKDGTILQVTTDGNTVIYKVGTKVKLSSLAISDKMIVIGTLLKADIVLAKRILIIPDEPNPVISGTIVAKISSVDLKKKLTGLMVNNREVIYGLTKKSTVKMDTMKVDATIFAITKKFEGKDLLSRAKVL